MSDLEIIFPQGREPAVRRLSAALAEAGYDVGTREVKESDRAPAEGGASAILILWDRSTMAHPGLQAAASAARRRDRAIDVSLDGITPLGLDDDRALIHLSGWRGDPHHPGWRKIIARLDRLCRPRAEGAAARPAPPASRRAADEKAGASPRARGAILALAGIAIVVLALAALLLSRNGPVASAPPPASPGVAAREGAGSTTATRPVADAGGVVPEAAPPAPQPLPESASAAQAATPPAAAHASGGRRRFATRPRAIGARAGNGAHRPTVRYTRYSRNMRLFCERAGRRTSQCRVFNAATAK